MKRSFFFIPLFLYSTLSAELNENNDFQIWVLESAKIKFGSTSLYFESEQRFGDCGTDFYFYYFQGSILYSFSPCVNAELGYRQVYVRPFEDAPWRTVYDPIGSLTFKKHVENLKIENRSRVQYLIAENNPNRWLYRNRTQVIFSPKHSTTSIHPLLSVEFFFLEDLGFSENRFEIGLIKKWAQGSNFRIIYLLQHQDFPERRWLRRNVIRLKFNFVF